MLNFHKDSILLIELILSRQAVPAAACSARCCLMRTYTELLGRDAELLHIMDSLEARRTVAIVAGPGEGKSALATEASHLLFADGKLPGGAYAIDLSLPGVAAFSTVSRSSRYI